jgi:hypothetical protein
MPLKPPAKRIERIGERIRLISERIEWTVKRPEKEPNWMIANKVRLNAHYQPMFFKGRQMLKLHLHTKKSLIKNNKVKIKVVL